MRKSSSCGPAVRTRRLSQPSLALWLHAGCRRICRNAAFLAQPASPRGGHHVGRGFLPISDLCCRGRLCRVRTVYSCGVKNWQFQHVGMWAYSIRQDGRLGFNLKSPFPAFQKGMCQAWSSSFCGELASQRPIDLQDSRSCLT